MAVGAQWVESGPCASTSRVSTLKGPLLGLSMFDPVKPFSDMFEPHGDGYVYFPSPKSGGKLISAAERDQLVADYRWWWAGFVGRALWIVLGAVLAAVLIIEAFGLPEATQTLVMLIVAAAVIGGITWSFNAPRRLIRR